MFWRQVLGIVLPLPDFCILDEFLHQVRLHLLGCGLLLLGLRPPQPAPRALGKSGGCEQCCGDAAARKQSCQAHGDHRPATTVLHVRRRQQPQDSPHRRVGSRQCCEGVKPGRRATAKAHRVEQSMLPHFQHLPRRHGGDSAAQTPPQMQQQHQQEVQEHRAARSCGCSSGRLGTAGMGTARLDTLRRLRCARCRRRRLHRQVLGVLLLLQECSG